MSGFEIKIRAFLPSAMDSKSVSEAFNALDGIKEAMGAYGCVDIKLTDTWKSRRKAAPQMPPPPAGDGAAPTTGPSASDTDDPALAVAIEDMQRVSRADSPKDVAARANAEADAIMLQARSIHDGGQMPDIPDDMRRG